MCIFCDRAKASLDDPLAGLVGGGGWDEDAFTSGRTSSSYKPWEPTLREKQEAERCQELKRKARLPVTVITGFLGAGKTTFVNHLLSERHGRKLAVIENEFGEVAIDDALLGDGGVERGDEAQQVILMPNGCMCCRVRGDLVNALKRLIDSANSRSSRGDGDAAQQHHTQHAGGTPSLLYPDGDEHRDATDGANSVAEETTNKTAAQAISSGLETAVAGKIAIEVVEPQKAAAKLDGIILECSGLDELAPVLQTFFADPFVQEHIRLDAVVCLCDSPRLLRALVAPPPRPASTASSTMTDGHADAKGSIPAGESSEESSDSIAADVGAGAATSLVMSQLALSDRVLLNKSDLICPAQGDALVDAVVERFPGASVTRCVRGKVDVDLVLGVDSFSLDKALEMDQHFADILADREISDKSRKHHHDHNGDHQHQHHGGPVEANTPHKGDGDTERSAAVATPLGQSKHQRRRLGHDRLGAQSVGVELAERPIDWAKFTSWLKGFLEKEGEELIWRLKGVLWTTAAPGHGSGAATTWGWGAGRRTVVQGLYGHFESDVSEWPAESTRVSRIVFIGDLTPRVQEALRAGVRACVAAPRPRPPPPKPRAQRPSAGKYGGSGSGVTGGGFASRLGSVKFGVGGNDNPFL